MPGQARCVFLSAQPHLGPRVSFPRPSGDEPLLTVQSGRLGATGLAEVGTPCVLQAQGSAIGHSAPGVGGGCAQDPATLPVTRSHEALQRGEPRELGSCGPGQA